MKKGFLLLIVCVMCAMHSAAQETVPTPPSTSVMLARANDSYYLGNEKMNAKQTLKWLETQDCQVAYDLFRTGYKSAIVGWSLLGTGLLCDVVGLMTMVKSIKQRSLKGTVEGYTLYSVGGALELAAVPIISVGYYKMHQTVGVYNTYCRKTAYTRPYWVLQASENGIGLAYKF